jgi:hypothetical protein
MAISRCRARFRATEMFARLTQAISNTPAATPSKTISARRELPTIRCRSGVTRMDVRRALVSGYCCASSPAR